MFSLLLAALLVSHNQAYSAPTASSVDLLSKELNPGEEMEAKDQEQTEEGDWLARIVPEFSLSNLFKPIQLQIPVLTLPDLPSYTIALS